jgi:hypothetical protein
MKILLLGLLGVFIVSINFSVAGGVDKVTLRMTVNLEKPQPQRYQLRIKVTNSQGTPIRINRPDLPWFPPNELRIVKAIRLDSEKTPLLQGGPTADFQSDFFTLEPYESVEGIIKLNPMMPTLLEDVRQNGVQINWYCDVQYLPVVCPQGEEGYFIISQGDLS